MIKTITIDHIPQVIELASMLKNKSIYKNIPFEHKKAIQVLAHAIAHPNLVSCFVYEIDGVVVGWVMGKVEEFTFSTQKIASDLGLFVHPSYRKTKAGIALIKSYTKWARQNADVVTFNVNAGIDNDLAVKVLERCGYESSGTFLINKGGK